MTLADSNLTLKAATSRLLSLGAQFVEDAIRDNPDGPVSTIAEIGHTSVTYQVVVGTVDQHSLHPPSRTVWHREVVFGHTDRTVAGGKDFVDAARAQEDVAWSLITLIRGRK